MSPPEPTDELEHELCRLLEGRRLVCEASFRPETLEAVRTSWHRALDRWGPALGEHYRALNIVFLVDHGSRNYHGHEFWGGLDLGASQQRAIGQAFESGLTRLGLETFPQFSLPQEVARRYVAVMLAHGGIPASLAGDFLRHALLPALRDGADSGVDLVAAWRADPPTFSRPIRRFLLYGGATAVGLLDRLISVVDAPRDQLAAGDHGLPPHLIQALLAVPESEIVRSVRLPRPSVSISPYAGAGPEIKLPPVAPELAPHLMWEIQTGDGTISVAGFARLSPDAVPLCPTDRWTVTASGPQGRRTWNFQGLPDDAPVAWFGEDWTLLSDAAGIRSRDVWALTRRDVRLASVEVDGLRPLRGEIGAPLRGSWHECRVERLDLAGVEVVAVIVGNEELARIPVSVRSTEPHLVGEAIRDALSFEGDPVMATMPAISLPSSDDWIVTVAAPDYIAEEIYAAAGAPRTIPIESLALTDLGRFEVTVSGSRGIELRRSFVLIPGLEMDTRTDPLLPDVGPAVVHARADASYARLYGKKAGLPVEIAIGEDETREELWVWDVDKLIRVGLLVSVPRLRWALRSSDGVPVFGTSTLAFDAEAIGSSLDSLVVACDRKGQRLVLTLVGNGVVLQRFGPVLTDQAGHGLFELDEFRQTAVDHAGSRLNFTLSVNQRDWLIAEHRPKAGRGKVALPGLFEEVRGTVQEIRPGSLSVVGPAWTGIAEADRLPQATDSYEVGDEIVATVTGSRFDGSYWLDARPFDALLYPRGTVVTGRVVRARPTGLMLDVDGWTGHVAPERLPADRPLSSWESGEEVTGRVVDAIAHRRLIRIGVGQFDPTRFAVGTRITATVVGVAEVGTFVDAGLAVGFIPYALEADGPRPHIGDLIEASVEGTDPEREQVNLSMRPSGSRPS